MMGAIFGSFACCQAYRIRYKEEGKKIGERSECLFCHHRLSWYELIPILSWMLQRGRCRKCGKKIGGIELASEVAMGLIFCGILNLLLSQVDVVKLGQGGVYNIWQDLNIEFLMKIFTNPLVIARLSILMVSAVLFWILVVYDLKWQRLPSWILYILIGLGVGYFILNELVRLGVISELRYWSEAKMLSVKSGMISQASEVIKSDLFTLSSSILALPGLYFLMYKISREQLVGGGDYLLALAAVLFLGRFELALTLLFVANLLALGFNAKMIMQKKKVRVPFGPYLIMGFWLVLLFAREILLYLYVVAV
jgi:type II secretory pathway, prepilin signal peptidase pulO and related peptidases